MNARTIDTDKCIGCGKCVTDCICNYLVISEIGGGKHEASCRERGRCIDCGHCTAICPQGAITGGKAVYRIENSDSILDLMARKRTTRKFIKGAIIDSKILDKIILAGHSAPTDRNRKSARMIFIKDLLPTVYNKALDYLVAEVEKSGTINPLYVPTMALNTKREVVLWNAEYLVVFAGLPANIIDASIASERMQLEASQYNVGTAYRGDMKKALNEVPELRELLQLRSNEEVLVTFAMGMTPLKYNLPAVKVNRAVSYL